jgi:hypothetical protein
MKVCTQCAAPTNRPEKVNGEIVCQECYEKLRSIVQKLINDVWCDGFDKFDDNEHNGIV